MHVVIIVLPSFIKERQQNYLQSLEFLLRTGKTKENVKDI